MQMKKQCLLSDIHYLYMRSFYGDIPLEGQLKEAIAYYQSQSARYWQDFNLYAKGMIALVQHRNGNVGVAKDILASLRETAISSEELGMYWKENTGGAYWNQADVETQALLIEAFAEIEAASSSSATTRKTIDELRLWLVKNKQTTQWKTTKTEVAKLLKHTPGLLYVRLKPCLANGIVTIREFFGSLDSSPTVKIYDVRYHKLPV